MKQYLINTFKYNDYANKLALAKMHELEDNRECVRLFSHLINSMNKWLGRVRSSPGYRQLDWWEPVYRPDEHEAKWDACLSAWIDLIDSRTDDEMDGEVEWCNPDFPSGSVDGTLLPNFAGKLVDVALQLNYHSIHHRAQIQMLIRGEGVEPTFVDYIGTKYRRIQ
jgi:uncharacterized damage-inducible protein DinB